MTGLDEALESPAGDAPGSSAAYSELFYGDVHPHQHLPQRGRRDSDVMLGVQPLTQPRERQVYRGCT